VAFPANPLKQPPEFTPVYRTLLTGVKPNIDFVRNSPVKVDKGILVDNKK
jgi:NAD(P)H-nitrite reductase large subunit